jgi:hypothetical protein
MCQPHILLTHPHSACSRVYEGVIRDIEIIRIYGSDSIFCVYDTIIGDSRTRYIVREYTIISTSRNTTADSWDSIRIDERCDGSPWESSIIFYRSTVLWSSSTGVCNSILCHICILSVYDSILSNIAQCIIADAYW